LIKDKSLPPEEVPVWIPQNWQTEQRSKESDG